MQLLDGFFRSPAVEPCFTDLATIQSVLDFEAALARAQARAGIIPQELAANITADCRANSLDLAEIAEAVPSSGNLAIPLVRQLTLIVRRNHPEAWRYVHYGATSQDALDTGLILQLRCATRAIQNDLDSIISALVALTSTHRKTIIVARTWLQHALPTTFGLITAGWLDSFLGHRDRLNALFEQSLVLQFGGAAGTLASLHDRGAQVAAFLAQELALPLPRIPWHSQRERIGEVATAYGLLSGTLAKIARDLSLYMQTEIAELAEPAVPGRGGSSTMPHKQNPVACAAMLAATTRVPPLVGSVLAGLSGEYQRSLGPWQSEWETIPEIVRLTAGASYQLSLLLPKLVVDSLRMLANLELSHGLIYAEAVTFALAQKVDRPAAARLVEDACRAAKSEHRHLREVLSADTTVTATLTAQQLKQLFDPANYLGSADTFIDAVLAAAESLPKSASKSSVTG
jgi:3-carboxy-cis,cis-muconate cycloisomerase